MVPFYEGAASALANHIQVMTETIETAKFTGSNKARRQTIKDMKRYESLARFNKKPDAKKKYRDLAAKEREKLADPESTLDNESLDTTIRKLLDKEGSTVTGEQVDEMLGIIRARLNEKGMSGPVGSIRNLGLMSTLTDVTSLVTQASEIVFSVFTGGRNLSAAWVGLGQAVKGKSFIKGVDVGLKQAMMEYQRESDSKTSKWTSKLLTATGFAGIDIKMKETFMNTQILKAKAQIKSAKGKARLKKDWEPFFGEDYAAFVKELESGTVGEHTQLMAYSKLMDYQPTDVIANPQAYAEGGNYRMLYMLKTFQLRQANRVWSDIRLAVKNAYAIDPKTGERPSAAETAKALVEPTARIASFVVLFSLAGATKDELRDLILGRELPAREHFWNNMLQLAMFSRYDWEQVKKDGLGSTLMGQLQPPMPWVDLPWSAAESVFNDKPFDTKWLTLLPYIGKPLYSRGTEKGKTTATNRTKSTYLDMIRTAVRNDNRQDLRNARDKIRKYNQGKGKEQRITTSAVSRVMSDEKKKLQEARS